MAPNVDYARMREQTMGSTVDEEAVTVNTRALIDKVLARYSGEWTTLRELVQNAADASATKVVIKFDTLPSPTVPVPSQRSESDRLKHVLLHHTLARLVVSNNGEPFAESDWQRLKRIAEGNPDETKIGAFGVGFYSVFADCESPFISSGDQTMAFYWKGNSLFTRRGRLPTDQASRDTAFVLDYRNTTSPVPNLLSVCQFLATSLTFVGLEQIDLWLDDWNLITLNKNMAPSAAVSIPAEINPKTKGGMMKIIGVDYQNAQIHAKWMNAVGWARVADSQDVANQSVDQAQPTASLRSFFSRLTGSAVQNTAMKNAAKVEEAVQRAIADDLAGFSQATVFLRISTVNVQIYCNKSTAAELERATKKPPPKHTKIAILTSSYDETSQTTFSGSGSAKAGQIFASVLPTKNGRIFIGFPTAQTTGLLAHISAPSIIPTVERESIDLNARWVRDWNVEMLRVAGIACRVAYNGDLVALEQSLQRSMTADARKNVTSKDLAAIMPAAVHALKQYTFEESTPSTKVGPIIEEAFWTCNVKTSITILSTRGILPSNQVRLASEDLSFVDGIPVVPDEIVDKNPAFLNKLQEFGLLSRITTHDIKKELEAKALDERQLSELLKWAAKKLSTEELDSPAISSLFDGTVGTLDENYSTTYPGPVLLLGAIDTYPNPAKIPTDMPMPASTIPFRLIKGIPKAHLESFGWNEQQMVPWIRYLLEKDGTGLSPDQSLTSSAAFAIQVLPVLSKSWETLSQSSKATVADLLGNKTLVPTKLGLRTPSQAYLTSVKLFDDLPTVQGLQGVKEKFLVALGVRKTVELSVVFDRLMAKSGDLKGTAAETKWSHVDLIKYLVSVREDIPVEDINKLRKTPICPMEQPGETGKPSNGRLFRVSELYEPSQTMRDLQLPLLHWPEPLRKGGIELAFLKTLGLKTQPEVPDMVAIIAKAATNGDENMFSTAVRYYISNHYVNGYRTYPMSNIATPFLPVQGQPLTKLALPVECFANKRADVLGFQIVRDDLLEHAMLFGVENDPPITICADRLVRNPPKSRSDAKAVFGYFAGRLNEIGASGHLADKLGEAAIVPIVKSGSGIDGTGNTRLVSPRSCFLGDSQTYNHIFDFVDFGSEANSFLLKLGCKNEPSASELAAMLVREPIRLLNTLGYEKYTNLLRRIADNAVTLKTDKKLWAEMKRAPFLLSIKEVVNSSSNADTADDDAASAYDNYDDDAAIKEYGLRPACDIVIIDDYGSFRVFRDRIVYAPQEDMLEQFYAALEAPRLSAIVNDDQRSGNVLRDQSIAENLRNLINERCRLFLHDHSPDAIRHDGKWVEKVLQVEAVEHITLRKSLKGYSGVHVEKKSAALHRMNKHEAKLIVTARPDMYEVSRSVMSLLIKRPKQQDFLALEMILESDIRRLKGKGYNVDRILRQKAAETRIAENARQKRIEEQQKQIAEEERALQTQQAGLPQQALQSPDRSKMPIPGAFDSSPEPVAPQQKRKSGFGFLSTLKEGLGLNMVSEAEKHIKGLERDRSNYYKAQEKFQQDERKAITEAGGLPPPYSPTDASSSRPPNHPEQVTPAPVLQQNLLNAVQASRAYDSPNVFDKPTTREIKETPTYCDSTPATNLVFAAHTFTGIPLFFDASIDGSSRSAVIAANVDAISSFGFILLDVAGIFNLPPQSIHMFYNESGGVIAFNKGGAVFANLRYFLQMHQPGMRLDLADAKCKALTYWFVTLAHELAHNLEGAHNSQHGFYTESFISEYFDKVEKKRGQYRAELNSPDV